MPKSLNLKKTPHFSILRNPNSSLPFYSNSLLRFSSTAQSRMGDRRFTDIIDISPSSDKDGSTPLRPIYCVKTKKHLKEIEEREDCFILDFDPEEDDDDSSVNISNLNVSGADSPEISVISEKGQVACRDYPHSRHICSKFPFKTTQHDLYCRLCYCYVCDVTAPCKFWTGQSAHCDANDDDSWNDKRILMKRIHKVITS